MCWIRRVIAREQDAPYVLGETLLHCLGPFKSSTLEVAQVDRRVHA